MNSENPPAPRLLPPWSSPAPAHELDLQQQQPGGPPPLRPRKGATDKTALWRRENRGFAFSQLKNKYEGRQDLSSTCQRLFGGPAGTLRLTHLGLQGLRLNRQLRGRGRWRGAGRRELGSRCLAASLLHLKLCHQWPLLPLERNCQEGSPFPAWPPAPGAPVPGALGGVGALPIVGV